MRLTERFRAVIPSIIGTTGKVTASYESPFFDSACGIAFFELDRETKEEIARLGISFFSGVSFDGSIDWRPTPTPNLMGDSGFYGSGCASLDSRRFYNALQVPGSYVIRTKGQVLMVSPMLGVAVYGFEST